MLLFWGVFITIMSLIANAAVYGHLRELHMWRKGPTNTQMKWCLLFLFVPGVLFSGYIILVSRSFIISEFKRVFKKEGN